MHTVLLIVNRVVGNVVCVVTPQVKRKIMTQKRTQQNSGKQQNTTHTPLPTIWNAVSKIGCLVHSQYCEIEEDTKCCNRKVNYTLLHNRIAQKTKTQDKTSTLADRNK